MIRVLKLFIPLFLIFSDLNAQLEVTSANIPPFTPENLIEDVFIGSGVEVLSVEYIGSDRAVGVFENGAADVGLNRGIIMSTGLVQDATNPEGLPIATFPYMTITTDPDILAIAPSPVANDPCQYKIKFIPSFDSVQFNYVFASEEYPGFVCQNLNTSDVFGFFISGPGITGPFENNGENIALVPGTNVPVSIDNVNNGGQNCPPQNVQFYNDNAGNADLAYGAYLDVFVASAEVIPCDTYEIKISLSDIGDALFDSAVFLEAKSFGSVGLEVATTSASIDGTLAEGCQPGELTISLQSPTLTDLPLDINIFGSATNGIDFDLINPNIIIPQGQSSVTIQINPIEDGTLEGRESIFFDIQIDPCNRDTFRFYINESPLAQVSDIGLPDLITACENDTTRFDSDLMILSDDPFEFTSDIEIPILPPLDQAKISQLNVSGVPIDFISEGVIKFICIDSLEHENIGDVDVYLRAPNGAFIELTTGNGGDGGNGSGMDFYLNTCFNEFSTNDITIPGAVPPYSGTFMPEGNLSDLNGSPVNGDWQLVIVDDDLNNIGRLYKWSICFAPVYSISYNWSPGINLSCIDCPNPLHTAGNTGETLILNIEDSYGCNLTDQTDIQISDMLNDFSLSCGITGTDSLIVNWNDGGNMNFNEEININGAGWNIPNGTLTDTIRNLNAGQTLMIAVRLFNNCDTVVRMINCTTNNCDLGFLDNAIIDSTLCNGSMDGRILVLPPNDGLIYSYSWDNGDTDSLLNDVSAGTYVLNIQNNQGCTGSKTYTIFEPDSLKLNHTFINPSCFEGTDGSISVVVEGGTGPYSYFWSPVVDPSASDSLYENLSAGNYQLLVRDKNDCELDFSRMLDQPAELLVTVETDSTTCFGYADGGVTLLVNGGSPPYSFSWDTGSTDSLLTDLVAGSYGYIVKDSENCEIIGSALVESPDGLDVSYQITDPLCFRDSIGAITVIVGNPNNIDFDFSWSGNNPPDSVLTNLTGGRYYLSINDQSACEYIDSIFLFEPEEFFINPEVQARPCDLTDNGFIDLNVQGGTGNISISWSGPNGFTSNLERIESLTTGMYSVLLRDDNSCTIRDTFNVGTDDPIMVDSEVKNISCNGDGDGSIFIEITGDSPPFSFSWDAPLNSTSPRVSGLEAGTYEVDIEDNAGCQKSVEFTITEPSPVSLTAISLGSSCGQASDGVIEVSSSGGTGSRMYRVNGMNYPDSVSMIGNLSAGSFNVLVFDENDCVASELVTIERSEGLSVDIGDNQLLLGSGSIGLESIVGNATGQVTYAWSSPDSTITFQCLDCPNTNAFVENNSLVVLQVRDENGCTGEARINVFIKKDQEVNVPTGFTPNNDSNNDNLLVHGPDGTQVLAFAIYNRWGESVYLNENFLANDPVAGWNGLVKNNPAAPGVYIWRATVQFPDGIVETFSGQSTLLR